MKKRIKLIAMLLCVFSIASLSSCTKDNNDSTNNGGNTSDEFSIFGKWKVTYNNDDLDGSGGTGVEEGELVGDIWEFKNEYREDGSSVDSNCYKFFINNNEVGHYSFDIFGGRWILSIWGKFRPNDLYLHQYWTWKDDLSYDELELKDRSGTYVYDKIMIKLKKI